MKRFLFRFDVPFNIIIYCTENLRLLPGEDSTHEEKTADTCVKVHTSDENTPDACRKSKRGPLVITFPPVLPLWAHRRRQTGPFVIIMEAFRERELVFFSFRGGADVFTMHDRATAFKHRVHVLRGTLCVRMRAP